MTRQPSQIEICEVGPRDGLQGLPDFVPTERKVRLIEDLIAAGCAQVFIGDTIGRGTAASVARLVDAVLERVPAERIGLHFHDTLGQGLANALACLERGIGRFDTSVAGLGIAPPIDVERVATIGAELCRDLGIRNDSKAGRALSACRSEEST